MSELVREPLSIGLGWFDMESAPRDGKPVWLTDGSIVVRCWWREDVHGQCGWRDQESFAHFRRFVAQGWQPYFQPRAPGWPVELVLA